MSIWDYLLPWEAIPNMIKDVKKASDKDSHSSVVGAIGKYADPIGPLLGDDWMKFAHERIPTKVNEYLQPISSFHRKYLDPIAMALPEDSKYQGIADFTENKSGDVAAAILGGIFGGGAILGGMGGGAAGGGAAGGGAAGGMSAFGPYAGGYAFPAGSAFGSGSSVGGITGTALSGPMGGLIVQGTGPTTATMGSSGVSGAATGLNWSDPQTYADLYNEYGGLLNQDQQKEQERLEQLGLLNIPTSGYTPYPAPRGLW